MFYGNSRKLVIIAGGFLLIALLAGCGTTKFKYIPKDDLASDPLYLTSMSQAEKKPRNYGAIKLQDEEMDEDEGQLFMLQRKKGVYFAETMVSKTKSTKLFFSFGINYRQKTPDIGLRLEF